MIERSSLEHYVAKLLNCAEFQDFAPNGLQVEGKSKIQTICSAVTASEAIIDQAIDRKADALIVHHGYFWRGETPLITNMKRRRLAKLLQHDINLFAYHLPLDCHLELGNNACLAKLFKVSNVLTHKIGNIPDLIWSGDLAYSMDPLELETLINKVLNRKPLHIAASTKSIKRIAWCSGGAQNYILEAYNLQVDAFISGEVSEQTYHQAKELNIHYYASGHYATEQFGVQALANAIADKFALNHNFLEVPNPV